LEWTAGGSTTRGERREEVHPLGVRQGCDEGDEPFAQPSREPTAWRTHAQACVVRLRRALGPAAIEMTSVGYRLCLDDDEVDVRRVDALVARGRTLAAAGEPDCTASTIARRWAYGVAPRRRARLIRELGALAVVLMVIGAVVLGLAIAVTSKAGSLPHWVAGGAALAGSGTATILGIIAIKRGARELVTRAARIANEQAIEDH
jgi:hypothetical protein